MSWHILQRFNKRPAQRSRLRWLSPLSARVPLCALLNRAFIAGGALLLSCAAAYAQHPDLTGMWLVQDPGSGTFEAWFDNVPKPALRPDIIKDNDALKASANAGNVVNRARRTADCPIGNLPLMMASSPAMVVTQGAGETILGIEANRARFIYTDGRDHSDTKAPDYRPTGYGHSIGHWEGDTLVVDTVAFPARVCDSRHPVLVTPGGGRAKETTHLIERYRLTDGGEFLSVTFTWEDPTVYFSPHTYSYRYKRIHDALPFENNDDLRDAGYRERQLNSVSTPEQK